MALLLWPITVRRGFGKFIRSTDFFPPKKRVPGRLQLSSQLTGSALQRFEITLAPRCAHQPRWETGCAETLSPDYQIEMKSTRMK